MKLISALTASCLTVSSVLADSECATGRYQACGNNQDTKCCPTGQYCQPWNPNFYQCREKPAACGDQFVDVDFSGKDLKAFFGVQPDECCAKCAEMQECTGYTFVNDNPGSPACFLKSGPLQHQQKKGAVSGVKGSAPPPTSQPPVSPDPTTPSPSGPCTTIPYGNCGSDLGISCCPDGQYCQPWNPGFYQCFPAPSKCSKQYTNADLIGNDIKALYNLLPEECCNECTKTPGCKAYTFINSNPGVPACYLKRGEGEHRKLVGAVSGVVN